MTNSSESKPLPSDEERVITVAPAVPYAPRHEVMEIDEKEIDDRWALMPCTD